ncbi:MAG: MFS transporter [Chitinophagia bacterium]|nr:MFS transporter [Chitinophagia bacterium]
MEDALRLHFNLTATGFGFLSAVYYYAYVPMQLPVGILMDRYGPKRLLTFGCMLCVIGTFLFTDTHLSGVSAIGRFMVGMGSAFAFVGVLKLATMWLPENKLAMVAGMTSALGTIGAMVGDNLIVATVNHVGWQPSMNWSAVFGVVLAVILWFGVGDHPKHVFTGPESETMDKKFKDLAIIIRNKQIWINGFYGCMVYLPTTVFAELWGIPYLRHAHHLTDAQAAFANSLLFFGFMIGAPTMGAISDKIQRRKPTMIIGATGAAFMMSFILYMPDLSSKALNLSIFVLGLFYSAQTIVFVVGRELSPAPAAGTAIALTNMIVMIGAMVLQPLVGRLLDMSLKYHHSLDVPTGVALNKVHWLYSAADYRLAMTIIPVGIVFAIISTFFIRETYAKASS